MPPEVLAYIGLGANLGAARQTLEGALNALRTTPGITRLRASSLYRSAPVDAAGPDYLNAVAQVHTTLAARALLQRLHAIEVAHGRLRPYRNAPRTLDLDLLCYGDQTIALADLHVPHPRMHERAFVLLPMMELAADVCVRGKTLATWFAACTDQPIERLDGFGTVPPSPPSKP